MDRQVMSEDNQIAPLAPKDMNNNPRSDEEYAYPIHNPKLQQHQKKSNKCVVYLLVLLVILSATLLVFSSIVLRPSSPQFNLYSTEVKSLSYNGNSSTPYFNVTLLCGMSIKNSNFGRFKYENSMVSVLYGGVVVGEVKLREGSVKAKGNIKSNLIIDVMSSNGSLDAENLRSDMVNNGTLNMTSYAKLAGKVRLIRIVRIKKTSVMNCSMTLNLTSSSIQDLLCS